MSKLIDYNSIEKEVLIELFKTIPDIDNWLCFLIESYIYRWEEKIYNNGNLMSKCLTKYGIKHEKFKEWFEDGQLFIESNYVDGKLNGIYKEWHENGQLRLQFNYVDDKENGPYKEWHENGQLRLQLSYIDGKENGTYKQMDENGQLEVQANYINGQLNGEYKSWYVNGQLNVQANYLNNLILHGDFKKWYKGSDEQSENGQLHIQTTYVNNKKNGLYKEWYENGKCKVEINFENDKII